MYRCQRRPRPRSYLSLGAQIFGQAVYERCRCPGCGTVDGVDGVGDKEPFAELEVVGGGGQKGVEEFVSLDDRDGVVDLGVLVWE